jgi:energy-coupling factor transport system ATP-binding protein
MGLFQVENLTYYYPEKDCPALAGINLSLEEGEFVFLTGQSGCGKSSLLRALGGLLPDYYGGKIGGEIRYRDCSLSKWNKRQLAREIGIIFQDPEQQLVMTSVEQEIAFGLENLGISPPEMRRRVAEVLSLFDLCSIKRESTFNLSGGQKQKVILAAVLAMYPRVLLLDEPTSQLDPVAAQELMNYIQRLNLEWGLTVVLVEQRIDRCFHLADKIVLMEGGRIVHQAPPREMVRRGDDKYRFFVPPVAQVFSGVNSQEVPLTIKEGRKLLRKIAQPINPVPEPLASTTPRTNGNPVLQTRNLGFAYGKNGLCIKGINLELFSHEITVILGENGAGKSTLLKNLNGLLKPQQGNIYLKNNDITGCRAEQLALHIGYLSQNPNDYLFNDTVAEEVNFNLKVRGNENKTAVEKVLNLLQISHLKSINPRDLSGGERQRVALGTVLVTEPAVLLLDEPTRGLDVKLKYQLVQLLKALQEEGKSIVVVTHDVEFAAEVAQRVVIMSDGGIVADGNKTEILSNSLYYAPQVNRLFRGISSKVMTVNEAISKLRLLQNEAG